MAVRCLIGMSFFILSKKGIGLKAKGGRLRAWSIEHGAWSQVQSLKFQVSSL